MNLYDVTVISLSFSEKKKASSFGKENVTVSTNIDQSNLHSKSSQRKKKSDMIFD